MCGRHHKGAVDRTIGEGRAVGGVLGLDVEGDIGRREEVEHSVVRTAEVGDAAVSKGEVRVTIRADWCSRWGASEDIERPASEAVHADRVRARGAGIALPGRRLELDRAARRP